jgi:Tfp pilus assembly pilus retraction ATPase PilT
MAAIGSLLGIVDLRKADGLVLATGEVPALLVGDTLHPLAMPPLTASVLETMLGELLPPRSGGCWPRRGKLDGSHAAGRSGPSRSACVSTDARTTVTLRRRTGDDPIEAPARQASDDRHDRVVGAVLDQAMARHASDVLFSPGLRPRLRVDGIWIDADAPGVAPAEIDRAFVRRLSDARRRLLDETGSVDLAFGRNDAAGMEVRFRVSLFRQHTGVAAALRPLWTALESLDDLNLPATLLPMVGVSHGLVLVTGRRDPASRRRSPRCWSG